MLSLGLSVKPVVGNSDVLSTTSQLGHATGKLQAGIDALKDGGRLRNNMTCCPVGVIRCFGMLANDM